MKKFFAMATAVALLAGCGKDDTNTTPAPDPNAIPKDNVRIEATLPSTVTASDKFVLAGSFKTNAWTPATSTYTLTKQTDGKYRVDVPIASFEDAKDLEYKVVKNPTANATDAWKFGEKDATCGEVANRKLLRADANKSVAITVANFRNSGTCPD